MFTVILTYATEYRCISVSNQAKAETMFDDARRKGDTLYAALYGPSGMMACTDAKAPDTVLPFPVGR